MKHIHLGFEVGTGNPVQIPLRHMVVAGQTQEAGKTTTMEALIHRANLPALAFITKRGEKSFTDARRLPPYFRERADWQFVAAVLEATMQEKLKFERAWIMKASKGAKTLADVQRNVRDLMKAAREGMSKDVYLTLDAYLEIVVPRVAAIDWAKSITIKPGINVMDLADSERFPSELQGLVMRSALEWVYDRSEGVITIIPEAWEFLPQGRGSPVKLSAEVLMRKGATLHNLVWLDSQDIAGVDKGMLRHCVVWLIGVQREANEIKRTLDNIPAGIKRPTAAEVSRLKLGQFFACYGDHVLKTYVQPKWMSEKDARDLATADGTPGRGYEQPALEELLGRGLTTRAEAAREIALFTEIDVRQAREEGYAQGFEKGYAAANATLSGQVEGVIRTANAFMDELRAVGTKIVHLPMPALQPGEKATAKVRRSDRVVLIGGGGGSGGTGTATGGSGGSGRVVPLRPAKAKQDHDSQHEAAGRKLLWAISCFAWLRWSDACICAGMVPGNGYFFGGKKWLTSNGLVTEDNDQVRIAAAGAKLVGEMTATHGRNDPPSRAELIALWRPKLKPPGPHMLDALAGDPEKLLSTDELAKLINRKPGNGYWYGGVKALRRNNLAIETSGGLQLSPFLCKLARGDA